MKKLSVTLSVLCLLLPSVFTLKAAQDSANISINTTVNEYLNFIGTAAGISKFYTIEEVEFVGSTNRGAILTLGTLGLESNLPGDCDIEFSAANNFRLRHTVTNERLAHYRMRWKGEVMSGNPVRTNKFTTSCSSGLDPISFQTVAYFNPNPQAGVYQDIVTVTVTSQ